MCHDKLTVYVYAPFYRLLLYCKLNNMSEDEYRLALELIKTVSRFFDSKAEANVFHVLAEAINYILSSQMILQETEKKPEPPCEEEEEDDIYDWDDYDDDDEDDE